jgi:hypothetical protein
MKLTAFAPSEFIKVAFRSAKVASVNANFCGAKGEHVLHLTLL